MTGADHREGVAAGLLAVLSTGTPVAGADVAHGLREVGYIPVGAVGKARTWKHPECPVVLTFREQPDGLINWSEEIDKINRHVCKVLDIIRKETGDDE
ncbi:MAG: hypothetical protein U0974_03860 [Gemmatimonadales bacterium]|nr:hypothetical protein [Gemmatimonadales bacterium]MDZ4388849.1 hypothetical protein [Gemmatimonadales bacterium]